jgi:peptidyl-dipeptidase A
MLFGRMASNPQWMQDMNIVSKEESEKIASDAFKVLKLEQLTFSRWAQVMYRFEKAMYENPDQDLNDLWWDIVEKYQMLKRPEGRNMPDWASKIHIATFPCYYHNYLLGELLASQLNYYITTEILDSREFKNQSFYNNKSVGDYLTNKVFEPGSRYKWNEMIEKATGRKLTAKFYADQFINN